MLPSRWTFQMMPDETEEIEDERLSSLEWYVLLSYDLFNKFLFLRK